MESKSVGELLSDLSLSIVSTSNIIQRYADKNAQLVEQVKDLDTLKAGVQGAIDQLVALNSAFGGGVI